MNCLTFVDANHFGVATQTTVVCTPAEKPAEKSSTWLKLNE